MLNPHNLITKIHQDETTILWQCNYCNRVGTHEELEAVACDYVYPPCSFCGQTPTCAQDCKGIALALSGIISDTDNT